MPSATSALNPVRAPAVPAGRQPARAANERGKCRVLFIDGDTREKLHRDVPAQEFVNSEPHLAHAPLAQGQPDQPIGPTLLGTKAGGVVDAASVVCVESSDSCDARATLKRHRLQSSAGKSPVIAAPHCVQIAIHLRAAGHERHKITLNERETIYGVSGL